MKGKLNESERPLSKGCTRRGTLFPVRDSYLVDPASSRMVDSKGKWLQLKSS